LPASSALLFCFHTEEDAPRWVAKRLIRKSLYELRSRGINEVFAVARWTSGNGGGDDCRFFAADLLVENGFEQVAGDERLCLMRVDSRASSRSSTKGNMRRVFSHNLSPLPARRVVQGRRSRAGRF
jgi:hypothetical protein